MASSSSRRAASSVLALLLQLVAATSSTTHVHNIHWNASNPMFRIDRTDNIIDINGGNHPWEYDQVNIVCPMYKPGHVGGMEKYIIYSVSKEEYDSCRITQPSPKIVALCNQPHTRMYFTITFRSFTPTPGGLEFTPGRDYYFISTSSRSDLHRRVGGSCSTHNMKVVFRVAPAKESLDAVADEEEDSNSIESELRVNSARPMVPSQPRFPWSQERDFRRRFSSSSSSSSVNPSTRGTHYYHHRGRSQPQQERRPKDYYGSSSSSSDRRRQASARQTNSSAKVSSSFLSVMVALVVSTLALR